MEKLPLPHIGKFIAYYEELPIKDFFNGAVTEPNALLMLGNSFTTEAHP